jgi:hypothetical protein
VPVNGCRTLQFHIGREAIGDALDRVRIIGSRAKKIEGFREAKPQVLLLKEPINSGACHRDAFARSLQEVERRIP